MDDVLRRNPLFAALDDEQSAELRASMSEVTLARGDTSLMELSMVSDTSARPRGGRPVVPAKMTSSILPPRSDLAPCSPMTQLSASTTLDLPEPFGPTTQVMPGSNRSVVAEANDLNPRRVRAFRCTPSDSTFRVCLTPRTGEPTRFRR